MRYTFVHASFAALVLATTACGTSSGGGSPVVPSPVAVTSTIAISGYTAAITGSAPQSLPLTATQNSSSGATQNVTALAAWASDAPAVASVSAGGMVTTIGNGSATITAAYAGVIGRVTIAVNAQSVPVSASVPVMTGRMTISGSPETSALYRARLLLTFTETSGGGAYDVTEIQVDWFNAYWERVLTTTVDSTRIAIAFGGTNTVPPGGMRTISQVLDYTYTQSGMTAEVTAQVTDSLGGTSTLRGTYASVLPTALAPKPGVGLEGLGGVRR